MLKINTLVSLTRIVFFIFLANLYQGFSQNTILDSVQTYVKKDTIRVKLLNNVATKISATNPDKALQLFMESGQLSDALQYKIGKAYSLLYSGHIYADNSNYVKAIGIYKDAIVLYNELKDKKGIANSTYNLGRTQYYLGNYEKALEYYQQAQSLSEQTGDQKRLSTCLVAIGVIQSKQGNLDAALENYKKALQIDERLGNKKGISNDMNNLGTLYRLKSNYQLALEYFNKALEIKKQLADQLGIAVNLEGIATLYSNLGNDQEAYTYFMQAQEIYEKLKNRKGIMTTSLNAGIILMGRKGETEAMQLFKKALQISQEINESYSVALCLFNIGSLELMNKDYNQALMDLEKSVAINKQLNTKKELSYNYLKIGKVYLAKKEYEKAMQYTTLSSDLADNLNLIEVKRDISLLRSDIYYATKQYKLAFENRDIHKKLTDSIINKKNSPRIAQLYKYEFKDKLSSSQKKQNSLKKTINRKDIELQTSQQQKLWWILGSGIILLLLSFSGYRYYRKTKQKQAISVLEKNQIKQKLLVTQMNPHFIFNSLENIQALIYEERKEEAADYLSKFSILTRQVLENSNESYISLTDEVAMIKNYMAIQQLLYNNKFDFTIHLQDTVDSDNLFLPPMLTQPFVENAVKHGLSNRDKGGMIDINFSLTEGKLLFEVTDNGEGFDTTKKTKGSHKSLAMTITKERLVNYTKNKDFVVHTENITDKDTNVLGAKVSFEIPYIYEN